MDWRVGRNKQELVKSLGIVGMRMRLWGRGLPKYYGKTKYSRPEIMVIPRTKCVT